MLETTTLLDQLKKMELAILKDFIRCCEEMELRYYVIDGTALGAVRHGGFIPWDDDIDVGMPRKDYEKFMKDGQKRLSDGYFVQNLESDPGYMRGFGKIRNSNTSFIETASEHLPMNHGVYIDVFPLDGYSYSKIGEIFFKLKKIMYDDKSNDAFRNIGKAPWKTAALGKVLRLFSVNLSPKEAIRRRDKLSKRCDFETCGTVGSMYDSIYKRELVPKEVYGEGKFLPFEDIMVRVPSDVDAYLSHMYGDYMQFPPVEERVSQHFCEIIDLEKPYTYYTKK